MYDLKYQSDFYNFHQKLVSVQLYKKDYGDHAVIPIRTSQVSIEVNYQDDNTPVIGTGVKIVIINEREFTYLEDLLISTEKQFKCVITYDGSVVFQGFSICDLNEQEFLPWSRITLQFTDYLKRLESDFLDCLNDIGANTSLYAIIGEALVKTGLLLHPSEESSDGQQYFPLYVNSTLQETTMAVTTYNTWIDQTWIENNILYSDSVTYDNTYDVLNKVLKSFQAFLYSAGDRFILERIDDITRDGDWVVYNNLEDSVDLGESTPSLQKKYNKQDGDFQFKDTSQVIEYESGLKTLILNLKSKQLDTYVFNNYKTNMLTTTEIWPDASIFDIRKWYMYYLCTAVKNGFDFRGMSTYFQWYTPYVTDDSNEFMGLQYLFEIKYNESDEIPTELTVSFKMSSLTDLVNIDGVNIRYCIMIYGGTWHGYYLYLDGNNDIALTLVPTAISTEFDTRTDKKPQAWSVSNTFNLTDLQTAKAVFPYNQYSFWDTIGNPTSQQFVFCAIPIRFNPASGSNFSSVTNYIGDIQINITQEELPNKLTYYINDDFIKTEDVDIDFYDLPNTNFANGLLTNDGQTKTELWTTYQYSTPPTSLMDIYARVKFGKYCRTTHKLKATILCDHYLKPFSILSDDNLQFDSITYYKMLLQGYTWDLVAGTYDIEAVEYTEEDVLIEEGIAGGMGAVPTYPDGFALTALQLDGAGEHFTVTWTAMDTLIGTVGYTLQRRPYAYNPLYWNNSWITIYDGELLTFDDHIEASPAPLVSGTTVQYRILGYNVNGSSLYCPIVGFTWW